MISGKCEIASNAGTKDVPPHLRSTAVLLQMNYINGFHSHKFLWIEFIVFAWLWLDYNGLLCVYLQLVLSACSSYFETVLSLYEHQSPIIILKDVTFDDMSALIRFMYAGEITVEQVGAWSWLVAGLWVPSKSCPLTYCLEHFIVFHEVLYRGNACRWYCSFFLWNNLHNNTRGDVCIPLKIYFMICSNSNARVSLKKHWIFKIHSYTAVLMKIQVFWDMTPCQW